MNANAFALYLPDFNRPAGAERERPPVTVEMESLEPPTPAEDPAKAINEAREQGRREALATARAEFERLRAADLVRYDERLLDERRRWTEDESDRIVSGIGGAVQEIEANVVSSVARILTPFVMERVRQDGLDDLSETLTTLLSSERGRVMTVTGPDDLIAALRERLAPHAASVEFREGPAPDVRATLGETVVETQFGAWIRRLTAASE